GASCALESAILACSSTRMGSLVAGLSIHASSAALARSVAEYTRWPSATPWKVTLARGGAQVTLAEPFERAVDALSRPPPGRSEAPLHERCEPISAERLTLVDQQRQQRTAQRRSTRVPPIGSPLRHSPRLPRPASSTRYANRRRRVG